MKNRGLNVTVMLLVTRFFFVLLFLFFFFWYAVRVLLRFLFRAIGPLFPTILERESTAAGYTFTTCVGYFAYPGRDTQVQGISALCLILNDEAIEVK
jgi:hypothetical protein